MFGKYDATAPVPKDFKKTLPVHISSHLHRNSFENLNRKIKPEQKYKNGI